MDLSALHEYEALVKNRTHFSFLVHLREELIHIH